MIEEAGIQVIAPTLSAVTSAFLLWAGRTLYQTSKVQKNLIYRVEKNEEKINDVQETLQEIKGLA